MELGRYQFIQAARPFSLVVALINGGVALALAQRFDQFDGLRAGLVILACVLLQLAVNLINDLADLKLTAGQAVSPDCAQQIRINGRRGAACFLVAFFIACYLIVETGWPLLLLCVLGLLGALGYTLEPINYKRRGLGVVLVFWMMGVLFVSGGYLAITGQWSLKVVALSLPVSLLTSLLLLSNEIRDYHSDKGQQVATLTVRLGLDSGIRLFWLLVGGCYLICLALYFQGWLMMLWPLILSLLFLPLLKRLMNNRSLITQLPPRTGAFFLVFGLGYISGLLNLAP
ncbi:MAG: prenyltransferase [Motiliproteus sp.]|nr:prenyltransferase [Motiliproteus sp.]MCW9053149.1 prenyltransferase [Motiliproteus sp.]